MIRLKRNFVFAVEFTISAPDRVWPVLCRHRESLVDLGARYVFLYQSITEPGCVLVIIGISTEQPLLNLLRSPYFLDWFDAVGVEDFPAVFAGEIVERLDIGDAPEPGTEVVVAAVTPVGDIGEFVDQVRASREEFAKAGIRRTVVYRAFESSREVMFVQQLSSTQTALQWVEDSPTASAWLTAAGIGAFPPVFVGHFVNSMRMPQPTAIGRR